MNTFFTSDIHLFHVNILKFESVSRPFETLDEMHNVIIERWNDKVAANDEVFILGDVSFGKLGATVDVLNKLKGTKTLVLGNHDIKLKKEQEFIDCFKGGVFDLLERKFNGKYYIMCHYPMLSWNKSHYGSINLFGHLHSSWKGNKNQINVGMDCHNLCPISIDEIPSLLESLPENDLPAIGNKSFA